MSDICDKESVVIWTKFLLQKVSIPVLGCFGIVGNGFAIQNIRCPRLKSTFNQSLTFLSASNILFLGLMIFDQIADKSNFFYVIMFPYFFNPLPNILITWEAFLLMGIATERFIGVWKPLFYKKLKVTLSKKTHFVLYILPPIILSTAVNIPKFFETEIVMLNHTNDDRQDVGYEITSIRSDPEYVLYYVNFTRLIITGIIPFIYLLSMNILIILAIKNKIPRIVKNRNGSDLSSSNQFQPIPPVKIPTNSYLALIIIVLLFLICQLPRLTLNTLEWIFDFDSFFNSTVCTSQIKITIIMMISNNFFLTLNSSINFLLYHSLWKKYKYVTDLIIKCFRQKETEEETVI